MTVNILSNAMNIIKIYKNLIIFLNYYKKNF